MKVLKRTPHILKPHKTNRSPSNLLFFDTETIRDETVIEPSVNRQRLNFGYSYATRFEDGKHTRESWCRFTDKETFFAHVISRLDKKRPLYCFAHNLPFDLTILDYWRWTEENDYVVEYFVLDDPPNFIIGSYKGMRIVWLDTLNYWRSSLAKIGLSIGLEKLEMPKPKATAEKWNVYAKRDVEIIAKAVTQFMTYLKDNDLGQFGLSAASISMSSFRHRFLKEEVYIHDDVRAIKLEREAYYGGLVECFWIGTIKRKPVYKLDVNSMYPFVMQSKVPTKLLQYQDSKNGKIICRFERDFGYVGRITIDSPKVTYPVRYEGRLCYCNGVFETSLCGPELLRAFYNGHIRNVHALSTYEMKYLFREYIDYFWKERQRYKAIGDDAGQYFVKIFMNSLYGKFGQLSYGAMVLDTQTLEYLYGLTGQTLPEVYKNHANIFKTDAPQSIWAPLGLGYALKVRRVNECLQVTVPRGEHAESFPAIAGYITSYAREMLLTCIKAAGPKEVYYCDTDSLFCSKLGYERLVASGRVSSTSLGALKLEGISKDTSFRGLKDYTFDGETKCKGIRTNARQLTPNSFEQEQFEGVKTVLKRGYEPYIDIKTIVKNLSREYNKGHVTSTGHVIPFSLAPGLELP